MLKAIQDKRIQHSISQKSLSPRQDPLLKGKPLQGELSGLLSVRTVGQRYRIIYQIHEKFVHVVVVAVGLRKQGDPKDVYSHTITGRKIRTKQSPRNVSFGGFSFLDISIQGFNSVQPAPNTTPRTPRPSPSPCGRTSCTPRPGTESRWARR